MTKLLFLALWLLKPFETVEKKHTDIKKKNVLENKNKVLRLMSYKNLLMYKIIKF